jgi:hypothetical protein
MVLMDKDTKKMSLKYRQQITNLCNIAEFWHPVYQMKEDVDIDELYCYYETEHLYRYKTQPDEKILKWKVDACIDRRSKMGRLIYSTFDEDVKKMVVEVSNSQTNNHRVVVEVDGNALMYRDIMTSTSLLFKDTYYRVIRKYGAFEYLGDEDDVPVLRIKIVDDTKPSHWPWWK